MYRCINAIHRNSAYDILVFVLNILLITLSRDVTATFVEHDLHVEFGTFCQGCDVHIRIQDFDFRVGLNASCSYLALTFCFNADTFRAIS